MDTSSMEALGMLMEDTGVLYFAGIDWAASKLA